MKLRDLNPFRRRVPTEQKGLVHTMDHGWVDTGWDPGFWQQHKSIGQVGINETVEACVSALAQTAAMCPIHLLEQQDNGEAKRLYGHNPERVLKYPNNYQTRTLFLVNAIRSLYFEGNAYAVAVRDERGAIGSLHLMDPRATRGYMDPESGEVFYYATPNYNSPFSGVGEEDRVFPSRQVMHLRLHTSHDPLRGETPIMAAANAISAGSALVAHQATFFNNMSRGSGMLTTDEKLTADQMTQLREAIHSQTRQMDSGKMPILSHGLTYQQMTLSSQDSQLVEAHGMTVAGISRAFRVPLPVINDMTGSTFNNAEALMNWFLSSGLGFLMEHIELELGRLFGLRFNQQLNFDTTALLRSDWKGRMEALGEGLQKGVYTQNEARAKEGLPAVDGGDEIRVQQQMVPLTWQDEQQQAPPPEPEPEPTVEAAFAAIKKGMGDAASKRI